MWTDAKYIIRIFRRQLLLSERLRAGDTLCLAVERENIVLRAEKREV